MLTLYIQGGESTIDGSWHLGKKHDLLPNGEICRYLQTCYAAITGNRCIFGRLMIRHRIVKCGVRPQQRLIGPLPVSMHVLWAVLYEPSVGPWYVFVGSDFAGVRALVIEGPGCRCGGGGGRRG